MTKLKTDLRETLAKIIHDANWNLPENIMAVPYKNRPESKGYYAQDTKDHWRKIADAAIRAYEAHRPRPVVVLSREEWKAALDVAEDIMILRDYRFEVATIREIQTDAIRAAFPWIKVEGDA